MPKSYYLEGVDDELWRDWVDSFPRTTTINERLVELIRDDVENSDA